MFDLNCRLNQCGSSYCHVVLAATCGCVEVMFLPWFVGLFGQQVCTKMFGGCWTWDNQLFFRILGFRMHFRDQHCISMHYGICILLRMPLQDIPVWYYHLYGKSHYGKNPIKPGEVCSICVLSSSDIFLISALLKFHVTDFVVGSSVIIYDYSCGYF